MCQYADAEYQSWEWQIPFKIDGLDGRWARSHLHRYEYQENNAESNSTCPVCGSVGWVWRGWFSCDGKNAPSHIALIESGDVFIKATKP